MYSNMIATGSNVIWVGSNMYAGNEDAIRQLDIGGLIVTVQRLINDTEYIRRIKEEFVFGGFNEKDPGFWIGIGGYIMGLKRGLWRSTGIGKNHRYSKKHSR
ncbi:MAG: hypothetical protein ACLRVO_18140 [Blautia wexlerae]